MVKIEPLKTIIRCRSSSSSSDNDDAHSTFSSSDSDLSLIETSAMNSSKMLHQRKLSTSTSVLAQGTILRDMNNNLWMIHQCLKVSHRAERFIYSCSQVKRSTNNAETKVSEENIVKTKITPLIHLTEKLKQSRQLVLDRARTDNNQLDYIFYGAMIGDTKKEIDLILSDHQQK